MLFSRTQALLASALLVASPAVLAIPTAFPLGDPSLAINQTSIEWGPCDDLGPPPNEYEAFPFLSFQCANISVPLDYTDPTSQEKHVLELARSPAIYSPSRGSILFNFGGPGGDGVNDLRVRAIQLHGYTGGYHDLVIFKPRGTGKTLRFSCYDTPEERRTGLLKYGPWKDADLASSFAYGWAVKHAFANTCFNRNKDNGIGELVGTSFAARDMMQVVDALGEDGLLRFWGFSYGTILGVTAAGLFPDRVDRIVLDAVGNPFKYYHGGWIDDRTELEMTAYDAILSECIDAGPEHCPLAKQAVDRNITSRPEQVEFFKVFMELLGERLLQSPIVENTTVISLDSLKTLRSELVAGGQPARVRLAAKQINNLFNNENLSEVAAFLELLSDVSPPLEQEANQAIWCGDEQGINARPKSLKSVVLQLNQTVSGGTINQLEAVFLLLNAQYCSNWPFKSKEQFDTDLLRVEGGLKTRNPILVVGNTYDTTTPFEHARNVSLHLADSVLLEQRGFGHGTLMQFSECTREAISRYFVLGVLPEAGTVCEPDEPIFQAEKIEVVIVNSSDSDPMRSFPMLHRSFPVSRWRPLDAAPMGRKWTGTDRESVPWKLEDLL